MSIMYSKSTKTLSCKCWGELAAKTGRSRCTFVTLPEDQEVGVWRIVLAQILGIPSSTLSSRNNSRSRSMVNIRLTFVTVTSVSSPIIAATRIFGWYSSRSLASAERRWSTIIIIEIQNGVQGATDLSGNLNWKVLVQLLRSTKTQLCKYLNEHVTGRSAPTSLTGIITCDWRGMCETNRLKI